MAAIPEKYKDLLKTKSGAHVATIGPKGEPRVHLSGLTGMVNIFSSA
ncbi:hypothetical protein KDW_47990 [Dictyobacter vulcani]|uniref:Pyridoxamine 5'-phosphate oxidase putative domain-containing protein n=1 Tax=Dictyobacter vulcani TaxID=2607529 RepID=A0A5J4KVS5_9CHLR|nr:hypothetical protein KDW_47990 [Dictyobacter vulcani]